MQRVLRAAADEKKFSQIVMMGGQPVRFNQLEANAAALVAGGSELHTAVLAAVHKDKQVHQVHLWTCAHKATSHIPALHMLNDADAAVDAALAASPCQNTQLKSLHTT